VAEQGEDNDACLSVCVRYYVSSEYICSRNDLKYLSGEQSDMYSILLVKLFEPSSLMGV
jgi:hypothetical protein